MWVRNFGRGDAWIPGKLCIIQVHCLTRFRKLKGLIPRRHRDHVRGTCVDNETAK